MTPSSIQDQALGWFVRLTDKDVPETAWLDFQAWLEADAAHGPAYDQIEQLWCALDQALPSGETAPDARVGWSEPVSIPVTQLSAKPKRSWLAPMMAMAAATVMIVGLWPEISGVGRFQTFAADAIAREVVLSDGSRLALNRHSEVRARIGSKERDVVLTGGEVAFDVHHDANRPFVVSADDHEVRVLGTAFNVLSHDGRFSVGVQRGLVSVSGRAMPRDVRLSVGQRIQQDRAEAPVLSHVDPEQASAWRQGVLIYRDADLAAVAQDLSRYLDKPVSVAASARALRFTGALRIGDEATMLRQLQDFVPIGVTQENDGIRLTARAGG